jgi:hypothetical protein
MSSRAKYLEKSAYVPCLVRLFRPIAEGGRGSVQRPQRVPSARGMFCNREILSGLKRELFASAISWSEAVLGSCTYITMVLIALLESSLASSLEAWMTRWS